MTNLYLRELSALVSMIAVFAGVAACGAKTDDAEPPVHPRDAGVQMESGVALSSSPSGVGLRDAAVPSQVASNATTAPRGSTAPQASSVPVASVDTRQPSEDGGVPPVVVPIPTTGLPTNCANQCGNQVIDRCEVCTMGGISIGTPLPLAGDSGTLWNVVAPLPSGSLVPVCTAYSEQCDGPLDATRSCQSIGFAGGQLNCSAACTLDDGLCESCADDPRILKCRDDLAVGQTPSHVALAVSADRVAVAWVDGTQVQLGIYDESLTQVASAGCAELSCSTTAYLTALSAIPAGWLLAAGETVKVLDADGTQLSSHSAAGTRALYMAQLAGSENTLLVRDSGAYGAVEAALLDADGNQVWVTEIATDVIESHYGSAAALSDGYLVALRTMNGAQVFRLSLDGVVTSTATPGGSATEYPQVAAKDDVARVVWADFSGSPAVFWAKLDTAGERVGEPVTLGGGPEYFNRSPVLVAGTDSLILFGGYTGSTGVGRAASFRRVNEVGETVYGDTPLQQDPNYVSWPQVAEFRGDAVAAWVGGGSRVGLAKWSL